LFLDYEARSEILSLFVPYQFDSNLAVVVAGGMAEHVGEIVDPNSDINKQVELNLSLLHPGETVEMPLSGLRFSGNVYIYLDNDPTDAQRVRIEDDYTCRNLVAHIRGSDWAALHARDDRPRPINHLGTDFFHFEFTLPSHGSQGDKVVLHWRVKPTQTP